jgi:hypothetical protein
VGEAVLQGPEIILWAMRSSNLPQLMEKIEKAKGTEKEELNKKFQNTLEKLSKRAEDFYKDYNPSTDKKLFAQMLQLYYRDISPEMRADIFKDLEKKYKGDFDKWSDDIYKKSIFADEKRFMAFLQNPSLKVLKKDPALEIGTEVRNHFILLYSQVENAQKEEHKGSRLYIAGLREMNPGKLFAPDANSTLRMTYGSILDYYPADAVHYDLQTTLTGVMEKEDPDNPEFIVDKKLKDLYEGKDFGRYGTQIHGRTDIVTCFLSNTDITGGNSGSPVMNANGELIGLAFDGNWEAMSGDIAFEPNLQRTISVDIRYVLFIIDKLGGCHRLIDELKIVE